MNDTNPSHNETSLALSYYRLFLSHARHPDNNASPHNDDLPPYRQDEWTEEDRNNAKELLEQNRVKCAVPIHRIRQYEQHAAKNWDLFYQRNGTRFFKDRHYLMKEFPQEFSPEQTKILVEIGCGVGNNILPLIDELQSWTIYGYDVSKVAVDLMKQDNRFSTSDRIHAQVWDISSTDNPPPVSGVADVCTLLFCLSAIAPEKMKAAAMNVASTLKPGGVLIFRDYGRFDEAQLKLGTSRSKQLGDNFYVKSDGTRCYYFDLQEVQDLFVLDAGLELIEIQNIQRIYTNRAQHQDRRRVWVQGRFRCPLVGLPGEAVGR